MKDTLITLRRVQFAYGTHAVLRGADLTLLDGERIGVEGAIGCGKSTLLHLIVGLLKPTSGTLRVFGAERRTERDFAPVRRACGLVFQYPDDQLFCPTVLEDVSFGPLNLGKPSAEARAIATQALSDVGLPTDFGDRLTYRLSGGEKRLVALASVLAMKPRVLLLDEPTASLDPESVDRVMKTLQQLPHAMLIVSHEAAFLEQLTTHRIRLQNGTLHAA
jgi:cobalt/nickel transport system ATP-binding protein